MHYPIRSYGNDVIPYSVNSSTLFRTAEGVDGANHVPKVLKLLWITEDGCGFGACGGLGEYQAESGAVDALDLSVLVQCLLALRLVIMRKHELC